MSNHSFKVVILEVFLKEEMIMIDFVERSFNSCNLQEIHDIIDPNDSLTMDVSNKSNERVSICDIENLELFDNGRYINKFVVSKNNLEET